MFDTVSFRVTLLEYFNIAVGNQFAIRSEYLARPCALSEPVVVYSLGVIPLLSTCPDSAPSFSRARDQQRVIRAAQKSRGDALNRAEAGRAAPSGAERSRVSGSSGAEGLAVAATRASSTTSPERVCASARLYSPRFPLRDLYSRLSSPRTRAVISIHLYYQRLQHQASTGSGSSVSVVASRLVSSRVCAPRPFRLARARAWTTRAHESTRI